MKIGDRIILVKPMDLFGNTWTGSEKFIGKHGKITGRDNLYDWWVHLDMCQFPFPQNEASLVLERKQLLFNWR